MGLDPRVDVWVLVTTVSSDYLYLSITPPGSELFMRDDEGFGYCISLRPAEPWNLVRGIPIWYSYDKLKYMPEDVEVWAEWLLTKYFLETEESISGE